VIVWSIRLRMSDGAAAALGVLAAGAEDIDWATGAGPDGGIDIAFPDGPADAKIHVFDVSALQLRLTRRQMIRGVRSSVKGLAGLISGRKPFNR
jgi:hypothetical protein